VGAVACPRADPERKRLTVLAFLGVLVFVIGLLGSVMLHEAGHFATARRFGMKATQFFVGFGPTLWSTRRGETEYGVKAVPAGGFVKIVGMTPLEEVEPGDEDRAFYRQPAGRKLVVLSAGSLVHFALCILLILIALVAFGTPRVKPGAEINSVTACIADDVKATCQSKGAVRSPASAAGLEPGDVLLSVDGVPVEDTDEVRARIKASAGTTVRVVFRRDGRPQYRDITPAVLNRPGEKRPIGVLGVTMRPYVVREHDGPVGLTRETGSTLQLLVTGTWNTLTHKLGTIGKVYGPDRDPSGFVGVVGVGRISGEIATLDEPVSDRAYGLVLTLAALNLFVGVFNLLPLLPLDGGHIAIVAFETVRDRIRRMRGYSGELQRVDMNKLMPLTFAVAVLFAGFTLFLLGADIVNPITLN
jgi:membrane-associated protease RseP (regulator of RpoE activity)